MIPQIIYYDAKLRYETDAWDLFESLSNAENVIVVDARAPDAYEDEHIPQSVNIPHRTMSRESTDHLDRSATYVIYCDGIGCNASTKGALKMAKLGFQVKELLGGLDWWRRDGYATEGRRACSGRSVACGC